MNAISDAMNIRDSRPAMDKRQDSQQQTVPETRTGRRRRAQLYQRAGWVSESANAVFIRAAATLKSRDEAHAPSSDHRSTDVPPFGETRQARRPGTIGGRA